MPYYLPSVIQFGNEAIVALGKKKKNKVAFDNLLNKPNWDGLLKKVHTAQENYEKNNTNDNLAQFMTNLVQAAEYLQDNQEDRTNRQQNFDFYVAFAEKEKNRKLELKVVRKPEFTNKKHASDKGPKKKNVPSQSKKKEGMLDLAKQVNTQQPKNKKVTWSPLENAKILGKETGKKVIAKAENALNVLARDKFITRFIKSDAFKNLVSYRDNTLKRDTRSHSFLGIDLKVDKYKALNTLIKDLEKCKDEDDLKGVLESFYNGKGKYSEATGQPTPYEILNKGQNITTRFFNPFGMRATTIELIDKLASPLGIGNEAKNVSKSHLKNS